MLDVAVSHVVLNRPRVMTVIRELVARTVAKHMGVHRELEAREGSRPGCHLSHP